MGDVNSRLQSLAAGSVGPALANADIAQYEAKARAQQQYAMNMHLLSQERQARLQVLSLAVSANQGDAVHLAEEFWAFITAGDPKDAEDPNP